MNEFEAAENGRSIAAHAERSGPVVDCTDGSSTSVPVCS